MTKRQGWLVLMLLSAITVALYRGHDLNIGAPFFGVLFLVFVLCWAFGKD